MDRDAVLAAALGAAVLTGCTSSDRPSPDPSAAPTPSPTPEDPDVVALRDWLATEHRLAGRYAAVVRRVPALAALRGNHAARAEEVAAHLRSRGLLVESPPPVTGLRGRPEAVLPLLARAERVAAASYVAALGRLTDPKVVTLGAELAAGARQHVAALGLVRVPR